MTRVLQIRRGTAEQNNNFTGLPGELTMDTDNNTLRIHDGKTLGGFPLAQSGETPQNIDISNIPDEIWADIVQKHTPNPFDVFETEPVPINSKCSFLNYIVNDNRRPRFVQTALVCQSPQAGYAVGDEVWAFGIGNRTNPMPNLRMDSNGLNICLMVGYEPYWVSHRETGETTTINDTNWSVLFRVYY